jgi:D-threo-aldose 1-dehydrogenase
VLRNLEASLERLGLDRVDLVFAHDLDIFTHGSEAAKAARLKEFMAGGYRALCRLRDEGVIAGCGAGVNEGEPCDWPMARGHVDIFLLAGRVTLLEQGALGFMDRAAAKGVGVEIGGP